MNAIGLSIVILGVALMVVGPLVIAMGEVPVVGKLPGDIKIERGGATLFLPVTTMLLLSVVITVIANVVIRLIG